ncbi:MULTISPECIES: hypothetical protein [unclassified Coleofasciculus]|nr:MULTISPECIES: hypothetical protein [unclassified Coleofasciculus]
MKTTCFLGQTHYAIAQAVSLLYQEVAAFKRATSNSFSPRP